MNWVKFDSVSTCPISYSSGSLPSPEPVDNLNTINPLSPKSVSTTKIEVSASKEIIVKSIILPTPSTIWNTEVCKFKLSTSNVSLLLNIFPYPSSTINFGDSVSKLSTSVNVIDYGFISSP